MLEYIFFEQRPWQDFVDYLQFLGLEVETARDDGGWLVYVSEDLDDDIDEKVEVRYEELLEESEFLAVEAEELEYLNSDGINVTLMDGRIVQAAVDPQLVDRLLDVVSTDELGEFVSAIAKAVENGEGQSLFQR
jgi:hypothetical protein